MIPLLDDRFWSKVNKTDPIADKERRLHQRIMDVRS